MIARRTLLAGLLAAPTAAAPLAYRLAAEPVADGVWVVRGADAPMRADNGGAIANIGVVATPAGAVLIDVGTSRREGEALRTLARQVTGQDVTRAYVTHIHPDHSYGAAGFAAGVVATSAAGLADARAGQTGYSDGLYRLLGDWMRGTDIALPSVTVGASETIGGRRFRLLALSGHSAADLAVLDEATGTLFAGDLVFHNRAPATPNADLPAWRAALTTLAGLGARIVVPGHGPVDPTGTAAIAQTRDWLDWLEATLTRAVSSGLDMVEAGALPIPDRFAGLAAARYELQRSVSHFYPALEGRLLPQLSN